MTKEQFEGNPTYNIFAARKQSVKPVESASVVQPQVVQKVQPKPTPTENTGTVRQYTGGSNNAQGALDYLGSLYTSPKREEALRKASVMNQRIMAVGDALRHIGNIYNTVQGAPAQQFNSPVQEEYARYEKGKALRDRANQLYYSYQQQKAQQDAQAARWAADYKLKVEDALRKAGYTEAQIQNMKDRLAQQQRYQEGQLAISRGRAEEVARHNKQVEAETKRHHDRSIGLGYSKLNETKSYHQQRLNQGGGKGGTLSFRGKNGFYSKNMSAQEANAFYNQAFDTLSNMKVNGKPIIDRNAVAGNVLPGILGGNKINMQARKEAVDKAIYNHPEAGELLQKQYEFSFDPRGSQQPTQPVQRNNGIYFAPWNSQQAQAQGGYGSSYAPYLDMDDEDDMFDEEEDFSGISI